MLKYILPGCARLGHQYSRKPLSALALKPVEKGDKFFPKVSIVIPSFNQGRFLAQTIRSITTQNYPNLQLLVVDGGSTDNSIDVIQQFEPRIDWWVSEPDSGQAHAINKGFKRADGEIFAWLNSDDLMLPGSIAAAVQRLCQIDGPDIVYGQRIIIDADGFNVGQWLVSNSHAGILPFADYIPQETLFWKREAWKRIGGCLDETFEFAMDWDLLLRFKKAGLRFRLIDRFMGAFRFHPAQKTVAEIDYTGFADMERLRNRWAQDSGMQSYSKREMRFRLMLFVFKTRLKEILWRLGLFRHE